MCRFIDNFMDIQSNAVTTDESIVLKLAEDVYFLVQFTVCHYLTNIAT